MRRVLRELPEHYPGIELDASTVMPNHVHMIVMIHAPNRAPLSEIVRGFKTFSARAVNDRRGTRTSLWQRGYYEHVIRDDVDLTAIREYIANNPLKWELDEENPTRRLGRK